MTAALPPGTAVADPLLAGPGEARALARAVAWAGTPLGPPARWPEALRVAVRLCLDAPLPMAVWAGEHFTLLHNDAYVPLIGEKRAWAMGRPAREVWAEIWADVRGQFEGVLRTGVPVHRADEPFVLRRDGRDEETHFSYALSPVRDGAGEILGLLEICQETSPAVEALRRTERELRQREAQSRRQLAELQSIYDSAAIGLCVFDLELRFVRINRWLADINGVPAAEHVGRTVEEVVPALAGAAREIVDRIVRTGEPVTDVEFSGQTPSMPGVDRVWVEQWWPLRDAAGAIVGVNVVVEEVTERRRAERALAESERRFALMFRRSPLAIAWLRLPEGALVEVNDAWVQLTGIPRDEALGKTASALGMLPEGERQRYYAQVRANGSAEVEVTIQARGRGPRVAIVHAETLVLDREPYLLAVLQDVTEVRRTEQALRDGDRRKTEFLAVLSHELRNPLAPIRNSIVLLDKAPPESPAARRARDVLRRQTDHLVRLVDDLLDLSRITHGKIEVKLEATDVRELVRRAYLDAKGLFEGQEVELLLSEPAGPLWVAADGARFSQMVGNLLHNALKFTPAGGRVELKALRDGARCEVRVRDTGQGLEPADLERIFDPFAQAGRGRDGAGGLGLGLALVKGLAEKHGGSVRAASDGLGHGAEFVLSLPLAEAPGAVADPGAGPGRAAAPLRVLLVEDNVDAAATLADLLGLGGHLVRVAGTGAEGLRAAEEEPPDVLICDLGLPDMTGHDVIRALRARERGVRLFATALTGYAQPQDRASALAAGFDAHLPKPPPLDALEALLAEAARRR